MLKALSMVLLSSKNTGLFLCTLNSAQTKKKKKRYFTLRHHHIPIQFLILALTFTLLAVDPMLNDRLAIIMTLFLTSVAFKLVVRSHLPSIPYLTYMVSAVDGIFAVSGLRQITVIILILSGHNNYWKIRLLFIPL